jgi:phosphoribosylglycinamide formyltransferase 2
VKYETNLHSFGLKFKFAPLFKLKIMVEIGTPFTQTAKKVVLCGSGELGKELVIELQRYGVEVVALDKYGHAPAMQVAHRSYIVSMLDGTKLREIIEKEKPDYIIPEVEAIATETLKELENEGYHVIPTAHATFLTMNREGIRRLAAEELGLPTSPYRFAATEEEFAEAVKAIGIPCVVKPIMSSSGHGQSVIRREEDLRKAWNYAQEGGRAGAGKVIVEGFVHFDYEITQLTVRHTGGTSFLEPVGHVQIDGDYRESWQPQAMSPAAKQKARDMARKITDALGGRGIFGVELFICGDDVIFSEVSPRPHDTGMVTMISQDLSQFALHVRAVLGLPIPNIAFHGPSASRAIVVEGDSSELVFGNLDAALAQPDTQIRLFGKPEVHGHRRMGVWLARGASVEEAREKTGKAMAALNIKL